MALPNAKYTLEQVWERLDIQFKKNKEFVFDMLVKNPNLYRYIHRNYRSEIIEVKKRLDLKTKFETIEQMLNGILIKKEQANLVKDIETVQSLNFKRPKL